MEAILYEWRHGDKLRDIKMNLHWVLCVLHAHVINVQMMQTVNIDIWLASERMIKVSKCSPKNPRLPSVRLNKLVIFNNHHLLWKCKYTLPMPSHSVRWAAVQSMCKSAHIINSIIIRVKVFLTLRMLKALASINTEKFDILNKIFDRNL